MAVGDAGKPVRNSMPAHHRPKPFASRVGRHVHDGAPGMTPGGPGPSRPPGMSRDTDGDGDDYHDRDRDGQ